MPNYENGKIYKLISLLTDDIYIGSTTLSLSLRKAHHRRHYKSYKENNKGGYCTSFKLFDFGEVDIILIEEVKCNNREQLHARERFHIENNLCVNKKIPCRNNTSKEYYQNNKEQELNRAKKYAKEHRKQINNKRRELQIINCECGGYYRTDRKSRHFKTLIHTNYIDV
jgi:hypothetical protein